MNNFNVDNYYLNENKKIIIKNNFKFIIDLSKKYIEQVNNPQIADVGCATGDFLYYLKSLFPQAKCTGFDKDLDFLDKAKKDVHDVRFKFMDITDEKTFPDEKYDIVYMNGLLLYFDEVEPILNNVFGLIKDGGRGFIFSTFNPDPLDVRVKVRYVQGEEAMNGFITHGNMFSKETINNFLEKQNIPFTFHEFKVDFEIEKSKNPIRTWTFKMGNGDLAVVNGAQILHHFYLLEIQKPPTF